MFSNPASKRYFIEMTGAFLLYGVLLTGQIFLLPYFGPGNPWRYALALLPMPGCLAALWAIMRGIRRMDELQRRIQFESLAFAFAVTALVTFGYGFLEMAGLPHFPTFGVWTLMGSSWVVGTMITARRYS